jgi:hypothetical protein
MLHVTVAALQHPLSIDQKKGIRKTSEKTVY